MKSFARKTSSRSRAPRARRSAFSLVELMIVVTIIAIGAALSAPSIRSRLADQRAAEAAAAIIRIGRTARNAAMGTGRAHLVQFNPNGNGIVSLFMGEVSGCNQNNWTAIVARDAACTNSVAGAVSPCIDRVDLNDSYFSRSSEEVFLVMPATNPPNAVCFQPNGLVLSNAGAANFRESNISSGGIQFQVGRRQDGTEVGVRRRLVYPMGSSPRRVL